MTLHTSDVSSHSEDEDLATVVPADGFVTRRRMAFAAMTLVGVIACAILVAPVFTTFAGTALNDGQTSARELLESSELKDAMTDNLVRRAGDSAKRDGVRAMVSGHVEQVTADLRQRFPTLYTKLEGSYLTPAERNAALSSMRKLSDPRVLSIERALAEAMGETMLGKGGREELKNHLTEKLRPHVGNMRQLHDEILPLELRHSGHERATWLGSDTDVDAERLTILKAFDTYLAQDNTEEVRAASLRHLQQIQRESSGNVRSQLSVFMSLMEEKFDQRFRAPGFLGRRLDYTVTEAGQTYTYTSLMACVSGQFSVGMSGVFSCFMQAPRAGIDAVMDMFGLGE